MRQIVLDIETTGLEPSEGHRIIEIGCIELVDRRLTERKWHTYLNPDRKIDVDAAAVHGISNELLVNQPRFGEIVADLIQFIQGGELLIHNASFDIGFLNHELRLMGEPSKKIEDFCLITDTLSIARVLYPSQKNNLDALCKRHGINTSQRNFHGALLDARLLAEVYLAMTGGQVSLFLDNNGEQVHAHVMIPLRLSKNRPRLLVVALTPDEEIAHLERVAAIDQASGGNCLWRRLADAIQ